MEITSKSDHKNIFPVFKTPTLKIMFIKHSHIESIKFIWNSLVFLGLAVIN